MTEIQKWADEAMFKAEPLKANEGPKAFVLAGTPDPLGAVAAMAKMYKGEVVRSMDDVTDDERDEYLEQILKTKLKAPLEAVKIHFMVEGVTRSFTHQMVRQRTAVYAQESLRFAVKEDMAEGVALPPSLYGTKSRQELVDEAFPKEHWPVDRPRHLTESHYHFMSHEQRMRLYWDEAVEQVGDTYNTLIEMGMPAEDARGLLPHNITTRLNYVTDMRALQDHAGNRLCTQAQFEWRLVWTKIIEAMRRYCTNPVHGAWSYDQHRLSSHACDNLQWNKLADIFRPVCYLTGKCEFKANFDRKCSIRDRVEANHKIGRPSSEWDRDYTGHEHGDFIVGVDGGPEDNPVYIGNIKPAEWLLDHSSAR